MGVGVAGEAVVADHAHIVKGEQRVDLARFGGSQQGGIDAVGVLGAEDGLHRLPVLLRPHDQIAAALPAHVAAHLLVKIRKDLQAFDRVHQIGRDRIMRAHDGAGFGRAAGAQFLAFEHDDVLRPVAGEVVGNGGSIQPAADDEIICGLRRHESDPMMMLVDYI